MLVEKKNGLCRLHFELFAKYPHLFHGTLLRQGGFSTPPFDSLNLGFHVGDDATVVKKNWAKVKQTFALSHVASMNQVHGCRIVHVKGPSVTECDGLITNTLGLSLVALHADCQAAIFYDPKRNALGIVHAGWRGQMAGIYAACVQSMQNAFGSLPQDLYVAISPSLGPCHAEFTDYQKEIPESFWLFKQNQCHFNLSAIAEKQLHDLGIPKAQIQTANLCTYQNQENFFSYRRDKQTGRHGTFAMILEKV
ncbi:MAG: hypothetical protein RLZZ453_591 [Chlamydiota bacterium]|jgi:YfiH family protein